MESGPKLEMVDRKKVPFKEQVLLVKQAVELMEIAEKKPNLKLKLGASIDAMSCIIKAMDNFAINGKIKLNKIDKKLEKAEQSRGISKIIRKKINGIKKDYRVKRLYKRFNANTNRIDLFKRTLNKMLEQPIPEHILRDETISKKITEFNATTNELKARLEKDKFAVSNYLQKQK